MLSKLRIIPALFLSVIIGAGCSEGIGDDPGSAGVERESFEGGMRLTVNGMSYTAVPGCTDGASFAVRERDREVPSTGGVEVRRARAEEPVPVIRLRLENIDRSGASTMHRDIPSFDAYRERLLYLSGRIQKDLVIRTGEQTIPAALTVFEETGGVTPYVDVLAAFDVDMNELAQRSEPVTLLYADGAFGNGLLRFELDPESFNCTTR